MVDVDTMQRGNVTEVDARAMHSIRVMLVEDSAVLAERLCEVLLQHPEFDLVNVVDSEADALLAIKRRRIDVVVLDLQLRSGSGFGVLQGLMGMARRPQVIVLTNHDLAEYHTAALNYGVTEFLDKARAFHRLPTVLHEMARSFARD